MILISSFSFINLAFSHSIFFFFRLPPLAMFCIVTSPFSPLWIIEIKECCVRSHIIQRVVDTVKKIYCRLMNEHTKSAQIHQNLVAVEFIFYHKLCRSKLCKCSLPNGNYREAF